MKKGRSEKIQHIYNQRPKSGKKNWAEIIFEVIMATDCPRRGFDRVRAENFQKRFKDISS